MNEISKKKEYDFYDILSLVASSSEDVYTSASNLYISISFTKPELLLEKLNEIHILILSFCASPNPLWGRISTLIFGISNAINMNPSSLERIFLILIEISEEVTKAMLHCPSDYGFYYPYLSALSESIINSYDSRFHITKEILFGITEHCLIGFVSFASLIQVLIEKFQQIISLALEMEQQSLIKIAEPISCSDKTVVTFFIVLWVNLIIKMMDNEMAIKALRKQANALIKYSTKGELKFMAQYLFNVTKATQNEKKILYKDGIKLAERSLMLLKTYRKNRTQSEIKNLNDVQFHSNNKNKQCSSQFNIQETQVAVLQSKGLKKSKKWKENMDLKLVEEAKILFWSNNSNLLRKGAAISCSDIESLSLIKESQTEFDKKNVLKIQVASSKNCYFLAFQNYQLAIEWQNYIKQAGYLSKQ